MLWLSTVILPTVLLSAMASLSSISTATTMLARLQGLSALKVDVYSPGILFSPVLESQFPTQLFHLGLNLLHMARGVVSLAYNSVEVLLAASLVRTDTLL